MTYRQQADRSEVVFSGKVQVAMMWADSYGWYFRLTHSGVKDGPMHRENAQEKIRKFLMERE